MILAHPHAGTKRTAAFANREAQTIFMAIAPAINSDNHLTFIARHNIPYDAFWQFARTVTSVVRNELWANSLEDGV